MSELPGDSNVQPELGTIVLMAPLPNPLKILKGYKDTVSCHSVFSQSSMTFQHEKHLERARRSNVELFLSLCALRGSHPLTPVDPEVGAGKAIDTICLSPHFSDGGIEEACPWLHSRLGAPHL